MILIEGCHLPPYQSIRPCPSQVPLAKAIATSEAVNWNMALIYTHMYQTEANNTFVLNFVTFYLFYNICQVFAHVVTSQGLDFSRA